MLTVIVCGAGPAAELAKLVRPAQDHGWAVQVVPTPSALDFIDVVAVASLTGYPVRHAYRKPHEPRAPLSDAVVVAPATYNTINKCAQGASDTYALGVLAEAIGLPVPVVILPFVNSALASRVPFRRSVAQLREEGVRVLLGPGEFEPHPARTGDPQASEFPWLLALDEVERLAMNSSDPSGGRHRVR
jgi:phosphopantothenoylcysteine synthetase/decarboxylase